jgi:threonine/homoserine/homoserine lactone efflux protein
LHQGAAATTQAALWLAVVVSGIYHGVNPGMGWPLAVSAGLMERRSRALLAAFGPLTAGHLLAMLMVILPFSLLLSLITWQRALWCGYGRHSWGFGRSPWRWRMARG